MHHLPRRGFPLPGALGFPTVTGRTIRCNVRPWSDTSPGSTLITTPCTHKRDQAELHAIQAHDKRLVQQARTVADESLQRAEEAVRAREGSEGTTDLRAEVLQLRADHAGELTADCVR